MKFLVHKNTTTECFFNIIEDGNIIETISQKFNISELSKKDFELLYDTIIDVKKNMLKDNDCIEIEKTIEEKNKIIEGLKKELEEERRLKKELEEEKLNKISSQNIVENKKTVKKRIK